MGSPSQSKTLSLEQIEELNRRLSTMRHDINNNLSLIIAAVELIRHKPEVAERMMATLAEQPAKISASMKKFSAEFERVLGLV
jgi:aspartokinase